jgi:KilA-N domain
VLIPSAGRYGGTYAHKDIAFEFGSLLSTELKLYLIKEFQRLKDDENDRLKLGWERLLKLNEIAINQMRTLLSANNVKRLK